MTDLEKSLRQKWRTINDRCKYNSYYKNRVKVDFENYEHFKKWSLMNGFFRGAVIHRKDREGNYSPCNCEFVTQEEHRKISGIERRRFDDITIKEIRQKFANGRSSPSLGKEYGYSQRGIIQIVNRETYKDV